MNITDCRTSVDSFYKGLTDTFTPIQRGVLVVSGRACSIVVFVAEEASNFMYDIYSLDGFEKWTKAAIADLKFLEIFSRVKVVWGESIKLILKTLEAQMKFYYATQFICATAEFIEVKEKDGKQSFKFRVPTLKTKDSEGKTIESYDLNKVLLLIGSYFDAGKFLQEYNLATFSRFSELANQMATYRVFQLPVVGCLCDKPKDFFIFIASGIELQRCLQKPFDWEIKLKIIGSIGKMALIGAGGYLYKSHYLVALAILGLVTQNASLFARIVKRYNDRVEDSKQLHVASAA